VRDKETGAILCNPCILFYSFFMLRLFCWAWADMSSWVYFTQKSINCRQRETCEYVKEFLFLAKSHYIIPSDHLKNKSSLLWSLCYSILDLFFNWSHRTSIWSCQCSNDSLCTVVSFISCKILRIILFIMGKKILTY
jgi:hypothetical protein